MRLLGNVALIGALATALFGQIGQNQSGAPRPLQTTWERSRARLIWSNVAGRLENGDTRVVFTVLAIEDPARAGHEIRGVRVVVTSRDWNGTIYIEDAELALLKAKVDLWATGVERFSHTASNMIFSSACPEDRHLHLPLSFAYHYRGDDPPELVLGGSDFPSLIFTREKPSDIAAIFARATAELKSH